MSALIGAIRLHPGGFRAECRYDGNMRVPDYVLKCVGFVGEVEHEDENGIHGDLLATGFFVSVSSTDKRYIHVYFVTAKHVARDLQNKSAYFLVNDWADGTLNMSGFGDRWWLHPNDETCDLAVTTVGMDSRADFMSMNIGSFVTPETLQREEVWVGDETFITGLFTPAPGERQNMPIVRHGNIAMIPKQQIQTEMGYADVYLVESRSIGGLSGSPVFVRPTVRANVTEVERGRNVDLLGVSAPFRLLGLMHGHWNISESEMNNVRIRQDQKGVNLGIGIVVPAIKIIETLKRSELSEMRRQSDAANSKQHVPGMDSAKRSGDKPEERRITKEDFDAALKKASRKVTPKQ
jgi:hypothetical protein